jgi:pseudouridine kinase
MRRSAGGGKRPLVVAIGGANIDVKCRIAGATAAASSNPGAVSLSPGGVARNIAENLARLGFRAALVSAVGRDVFGARLLAATAAAGVDVRAVARENATTGCYAAVLDRRGDLEVAVAAMDVLERLTPRRLARHAALLARADLLVADGNLPATTIDWLLDWAARHGTPLSLEAVSVPKALRLKPLLARGRPLFALFCNAGEAAALSGRRDLAGATRRLHALGARCVCIGRGRRGMFVSDGGTRRIVPAYAAEVVDATGAGDAAVAGTLYGLLRGDDLAAAARYGQAAAALTLACAQSVSPRLSARALERCLRGRRPSP